MPMNYRKEMLADWYGAGKAISGYDKNGTNKWYESNKNKMVLGKETREWVEKKLEENS